MTTPFRFQDECVGEIDEFYGRALVALPPGLGKTLISYTWALRNPAVRPVVVVCPASLKFNWVAEATKHSTGFRCEVLEGRKPQHLDPLKADVWVVNYDVLADWLGELRRVNPMLVIADECHMAKSRTAKRSKALRSLCKGVPCVLALSGTPLVNRPAELYNVLNILRPELYPSFFQFATEYCRLRRTPWGLDYSGAKNLGRLHSRLLRECMVRRKKEDVLKDLPPKRRNLVTLPIEGRSQYDLAVKDFLAWLRANGERTGFDVKSQKIVQIGAIKRLAARLKMGAALEWVDNFLEEGEDKILLFAVHKPVISELKERYGKGCVVVDGSVTGRDRQRAFDRFQSDPGVRVFVGNIQAAGTGWNATAASDVAFVEMAWTPGEMVQAEDRVHRIGQDRPVTIHYLLAHDTIEEDLCQTLERKARVLSHTLDGSRDQSDLDIYDLLERSLRDKES